MKKLFAFMIALAVLASLFSAVCAEGAAPALPEEGWVADSLNGDIWQDGRATLEVILKDEFLKVQIIWGSSAWELTEWQYFCSYDAETQSLAAVRAVCDNVLYDDEANETRTNVFDQESEAVFSLNDEGKIVVLNAGDDALEGKTFERVIIDINE